jgi:hypothetical protein
LLPRRERLRGALPRAQGQDHRCCYEPDPIPAMPTAPIARMRPHVRRGGPARPIPAMSSRGAATVSKAVRRCNQCGAAGVSLQGAVPPNLRSALRCALSADGHVPNRSCGRSAHGADRPHAGQPAITPQATGSSASSGAPSAVMRPP